MKHCGNENCKGNACANWRGCMGETIPPYKLLPAPSTAAVCVREQDVLKAADELAEAVKKFVGVCEFHVDPQPEPCQADIDGVSCENWEMCYARAAYVRAREGRRS